MAHVCLDVTVPESDYHFFRNLDGWLQYGINPTSVFRNLTPQVLVRPVIILLYWCAPTSKPVMATMSCKDGSCTLISLPSKQPKYFYIPFILILLGRFWRTGALNLIYLEPDLNVNLTLASINPEIFKSTLQYGLNLNVSTKFLPIKVLYDPFSKRLCRIYIFTPNYGNWTNGESCGCTVLGTRRFYRTYVHLVQLHLPLGQNW